MLKMVINVDREQYDDFINCLKGTRFEEKLYYNGIDKVLTINFDDMDKIYNLLKRFGNEVDVIPG